MSPPDSLRDPAVESERFKRDSKASASVPDIRDVSALQASPFHGSR